MMDFDVFLKAPSSIAGPRDDIVPRRISAATISTRRRAVTIVGTGGKEFPPRRPSTMAAHDWPGHHRPSKANRSQRRAMTRQPARPWLVTRDEAADPSDIVIDSGATASSAAGRRA